MKSLVKARDMLSLIAGTPGIALPELSRKLSMPKSTAYRILRALESSGFVAEMEDGHRFRLGPLIGDLAKGFTRRERLTRVTRPELVKLRDKCDETVALHVLEANRWVVIDQVESTQELRRTITNLGEPMPLGAAATGKLFLAFMPQAQRNAYFKEQKLVPHTTRTPNRQSLEKDLQQIVRNGYATSIGELVSGVSGLSMPIRSRDGAVRSAVGISGPSGRFAPKEVLAMRDALKKTIKEIEKQLAEEEPNV
jgi:IclR family acetate operon transcriptional repressor